MGGVHLEGGCYKNWGDERSVNGEMGKDFCPNFVQPLLENCRLKEL